MFKVIRSDLTEHGPFPTLASAMVYAEGRAWTSYSIRRIFH